MSIREKDPAMRKARQLLEWNPSRTTFEEEERKRGAEKVSFQRVHAVRLFFPCCLVVRTRHTETNSPERECAKAFTTRGRVYGCFSTDVVNA